MNSRTFNAHPLPPHPLRSIRPRIPRRVSMGECFVYVTQEEAEARLETALTECQTATDDIKKESEDCEKVSSAVIDICHQGSCEVRPRAKGI